MRAQIDGAAEAERPPGFPRAQWDVQARRRNIRDHQGAHRTARAQGGEIEHGRLRENALEETRRVAACSAARGAGALNLNLMMDGRAGCLDRPPFLDGAVRADAL
jgi:hypothetical protein